MSSAATGYCYSCGPIQFYALIVFDESVANSNNALFDTFVFPN